MPNDFLKARKNCHVQEFQKLPALGTDMSTVHSLNVGQGDCTLIQHNSGRTSLIDICKGNYQPPSSLTFFDYLFNQDDERPRLASDFGMSKKPTNPLSYLSGIGITSLFRFILTHPDMDHLDGFAALMNKLSLTVFWDSGVRKEKPNFENYPEYKEEDWDAYVSVRDGKQAIHVNAGGGFKYANRDEDGSVGGDGLYILAPDKDLVATANECGDVNDASYVLLYRSRGGRIVIPGDAHDETWDYVIKHHKDDVANCSVLFAPHHGRKSGRNFDFLNVLRPKITFFGCASSGHLAYNAWSSRKLPVLTNNQAGNIVLECGESRIDIYVENAEFAKACGCDLDIKNNQGYVYYHATVEPVKSTA